MIIDLIAGARPNFMKIAPIIDAINTAQSRGEKIKYRLIHTGQHYDQNMSDSFFKQLSIPFPDINLNAGSGTHAEQTSAIMIGYEKILRGVKTDICLVVGDVNSTLACSIVAKKMGLLVAHVEAGIRSFDLSMPEEINRMVTDSITDYFFTTSETANKNLTKAGINEDRIFFVGNTMIDTLLKNQKLFVKPKLWLELQLENKNYFVMTLHRPGNVDNEKNIKNILSEIDANSNNIPVIFPVHPRTQKKLYELRFLYPNIYFIPPQGYLEFNYLVERSLAVITDSGGITEETTVMNIPCITIRNSTERPETVEIGTNELIGDDPKDIQFMLKKLFSGKWKKGKIPKYWDGRAAQRIIDYLLQV